MTSGWIARARAMAARAVDRLKGRMGKLHAFDRARHAKKIVGNRYRLVFRLAEDVHRDFDNIL
ncbi:hypothetical protein AJ87_16815 [Rhizobium yanglingense]|nr:hypothetical protein AJ87_16815 [Rhizobium yanglingense]